MREFGEDVGKKPTITLRVTSALKVCLGSERITLCVYLRLPDPEWHEGVWVHEKADQIGESPHCKFKDALDTEIESDTSRRSGL